MINECIDKPSFSLPKINSYEGKLKFISLNYTLLSLLINIIYTFVFCF